MGTFITNFHIRGANSASVITALQSIGTLPAYVSTDDAEWISLYPEGIDQDGEAAEELVKVLSVTLHVPVIALMVHDSDIFWYWLFDDGTEIDIYDSTPGYFDDDVEEDEPEGGDAEALKPYCIDGVSIVQLNQLLRPEEPPVFAEESATELAGLRGISEGRAAGTFEYLAAGEGMVVGLLLVDADGVHPVKASGS